MSVSLHKKISVIAPVYNEEETISDYINQTLIILKKNFNDYELLLIDDGSTDRSLEICKTMASIDHHLRIISLSRNYGQQTAMTAGFTYADGDYIVIMDSDLQDPPELIPDLINKALEGYDVVYAKRTERLGETWFKKITSKLFYRIASRMTGLTIPDDAGDYRVFSRKVIDSLNSMHESNRYLKMLYAYVGYNSASIPFTRYPRKKGKSKYNYLKLFNAALDGIISFSNKPLRYLSVASVFISFFCFLLSIFAVIQKIIYLHIASGWASLFVLISLMFSLLFLFLAIISEYISRILVETKHRPLFYVKEDYSIKNNIQDKYTIET